MICPICTYKYVKEDKLRVHISREHSDEEIHYWGMTKREIAKNIFIRTDNKQ